MKIEQQELIEITIDFMQTLFDENNPVYDENMNNLGRLSSLKHIPFKQFLQYKTGISFLGHDETYYDLYVEKLQEYILWLLAEEGKEDQLDSIPLESYVLHLYDEYSIEEITKL